jgi:hypothetical protein
MLLLTIAAVSTLVAFFFYHRTIVMKLQHACMNLETNFEFMEHIIEMLRMQQAEMEKAVAINSVSQKANKKKKGRPVNPNSAHQKRLRAKLKKTNG